MYTVFSSGFSKFFQAFLHSGFKFLHRYQLSFFAATSADFSRHSLSKLSSGARPRQIMSGIGTRRLLSAAHPCGNTRPPFNRTAYVELGTFRFIIKKKTYFLGNSRVLKKKLSTFFARAERGVF